MTNDIKVTIPLDNTVINVPKGSKVIKCLSQSTTTNKLPLLAAKLNNEFVSLDDSIMTDCTIEPVVMDDIAGKRIYRQSLNFLLRMAIKELHPDRPMAAGSAIGNGFFCRFADHQIQLTIEQIKKLENTMRSLVKRSLPIKTELWSWEKAIAYFQQENMHSTVMLIKDTNRPRLRIWNCNQFIILRHYPLVNNTDMLEEFSLESYKDGFLLRFPSPNSAHIKEHRDNEPLMYDVYKEHRKWADTIGVSNVPALNAISQKREQAKEFIQTTETLHDRQISKLTGMIHSQSDSIKIVMIAGPSSSGKTTFIKKLAMNIKSIGLKPQLISLDDYYKPRKDIPLDKEGKPDFEALDALDIALLNENIEDLMAGRETNIPIFDFKNVGKRLPQSRKMCMEENGILIFEGIHGLNPNLIPGLYSDKIFRIYISALIQINLDDQERISTTDTRLIRRIVRDYQFRNYEAIKTLEIWPSVRRGEELHIFPWQKTAHVMFNSSLAYEIPVLKIFAEPLLKAVNPLQKSYGEARRLLNFLQNFHPFPVEEVPQYSILREFIGHSGFHY